MENSQLVARATALMAANAYALITAMRLIEENNPPPLATLVVGVPALGLSFAYGMLEGSPRTARRERLAGLMVVLMLLAWIYWQYNY